MRADDGDAQATPMRPEIGVLEWFHIGETDHVERTIQQLKELDVKTLRTGVSWAEWHLPEGRAWIDWLIPRLAREVEIVPCFHYTPPSLGVREKTSSPPREPQDYADFVGEIIGLYGEHFEWVEFWNEPNNLSEWDWTLDPEWTIFCDMIGGAAAHAHELGKKTLLGGMSPVDPNWLRLMIQRGLLEHMDAIGIHGFPGTWEADWRGWDTTIGRIQALLDGAGSDAEIWITETGYTTWPYREAGQVRAFLDLKDLPVPRIYWYGAEDLDARHEATKGYHVDEREYHCGIRTPSGRRKLLDRLWASEGLAGMDGMAWMLDRPRFAPDERPVLVTGGAGFIGSNLVHRLISDGRPVLILDDLSREGTLDNLRWLRAKHGDKLRIRVGDIRDVHVVEEAVERASGILHLAGQVAVTTSLERPLDDFQVNAEGTVRLLDAVRRRDDPPPFVFASTNKVYGALDRFPLKEGRTSVEPVDSALAHTGFDEQAPLDLQSPYGCSKGAADQYVLDHARCYGLPATVFRMSCMYGPLQHGNEDQGWVAHFARSALEGRPVTVYGDGRQVRDILYVSDVVDAFLLGLDDAPRLAGHAFNIGGGPDRATSILDLLHRLKARGHRLDIQHEPPRVGDQRYYVSDTRAFTEATGWRPKVDVEEGLDRLIEWLRGDRIALEKKIPLTVPQKRRKERR